MTTRERMLQTRVWVQQAPEVNLFRNPNAYVDLTDAGAVNLTSLVRQTGVAANDDYDTAFRLNGDGAASDSYLHFGNTGDLRNGMQEGKTYTVRGTFYLDNVLAGSSSSRRRSIVAFVRDSGGTYTEYASARADNTAGAHDLSVEFPIPAGATEAFVRFYHGHADTESAYWYRLRLSEGTIAETGTDFWDGATYDPDTSNGIDEPTGGWDGTPHKSTSWRIDRAESELIPDAEVEITYDVERVPFIHARITAPNPGESILELLDPRRPRDVILNFIVEQFRRGVTEEFDTSVGLLPLSSPSGALATPGKLWLRSIDIDDMNDTISMAATSGEIRTDDKIRVVTTAIDTGATNVSEMVEFALTDAGEVSFVDDISAASGTSIPSGDRRYWLQGQALSNLYESELAALDLRLYCDDEGRYSVAGFDDPPVPAGGGSDFTLQDGDGVFGILISASRRYDREGGWADAVIVKSEYRDSAGTLVTPTYQRHLADGVSSRKGMLETIARAMPSSSYAESITNRAAKRGETYALTAQIDFGAYVGRTIDLTITGRDLVELFPTRVTYRTATGTMQIEAHRLGA